MRTEATFLTAALLLHALGLPLLVRYAPHRDLLAGSSRELRSIEVEVTETPPFAPPPKVEPPPEAPPPPESTPPSPETPRPNAVAPAPPGPRAPVEGPENPAGPAAPGPTPPPGPRSEYDAPPSEGTRVITGLEAGGPRVYSMPGMIPPSDTFGRPAPAPTVAPKPREVDPNIAGKLIAEGMKEKDKHAGLQLPAAGTVASTLRDVVQGSDTPNDARATFEVRLDGSGKVVGVRLVSFNAGGADAWGRVAAAAAAALKGKALAMTGSEYAKGAVVTINVSSVAQLPSGNGSGLKGAGATFDVSNIGAHKTRVVRYNFNVSAVK